jgi:hypothetical protein
MTAVASNPNAPPTNGRDRRLVFLGSLSVFGAASLALVIAATKRYPGQRPEFILFIVAYVLMALLALPKPRSYGYSFLAGFLFLGFCAKAVAYFALGIALVEPTGAFDGSGRAWDVAVVPATMGSAAVITIRIIHLAVFRTHQRTTLPVWSHSPIWYVNLRIPVLIASGGVLAALTVANLLLAFYQVGVTPKAVLPAHLNVPIEWLFVTGFAMWAATLTGWESQLALNRLGPALLIPLAEAVASLVTLSRAAYLFRALPYLMVVGDFPAYFRMHLSGRWRSLLLVLMVAGLVVSLVGVAFLRIATYPLVSQVVTGPVPSATPTVIVATPTPTSGLQGGVSDPRFRFVGRELSLLIVGRWIGIEGIMSVSSHAGLGVNLFESALRENPAAGEASIYQHISGSSYQTTSNYVFLTTPGAIGVLYYSGSLIVVFAGMAGLTALLISVEMVASYLLGNAFTVSIVAIALANAVAQMNFPYLFVVLVAEQVVAVLVLGVVGGRLLRKADRNLATERNPSRSASPL